ncbi:smoothelin-like protein 2 [Microcaecilia unicolor]|uniref:Smoothelin-like protein 2 n=1 Tax=Microcaecilia unicolor TaxID=1415580 RepID=A0A6P7WV22_9AMPH|nr:smoothelin-like protein 2 [Microcaecilia unicolor]
MPTRVQLSVPSEITSACAGEKDGGSRTCATFQPEFALRECRRLATDELGAAPLPGPSFAGAGLPLRAPPELTFSPGMDPSSEIADLSSRDARTVCEALGRYEDTLRGAVREIHADIQVFKKGVERRVEDVLRMAGPLAGSVADLQQENRRLRGQLECLCRQVELLSSSLPEGSPAGRFSGQALLAMGGAVQNVEQDVRNEFEAKRITNSSVIENGHQPLSAQTKVSHEVAHSVQVLNSSSQEHSPAIVSRMPHLPVTAVTRVSETFSGETSTSAPIFTASSGQLAQSHSKSHNEVMIKSSNQTVGAVKTWGSSSVRTMGMSSFVTSDEKNSSVTKSVTSVSYGMSSDSKSKESATNSYYDVMPKSQTSPPVIHRQVERRKELVRSQTLPRTSGTQARKALFEKFEQDTGKGKGESKVKLKRSQSFGVASASSIKQILLEWCRSKTIGYKKIDIQNFSSSWSDGMAFCALVHSFFPEAFDYNALDPANHKQNFELAFSTAEKLAQCDRLIEVEDMLLMGRKPDPMCVFTYVQSLYNHLRRYE